MGQDRGVLAGPAEAQEIGIALVGSVADHPVRLSVEPATVVLDVRRSQPEADLDLTPVVRVAGERDLPVERLRLIGSPVHGLFVDAPQELLLATFDPPLDETTSRLLGQGELRVPAAEEPSSRTREVRRRRITPHDEIQTPPSAPRVSPRLGTTSRR